MCQAVLSTTAAVGARADFERARRCHLAARVGRLLKARRPSRTRPRDLGDVAALFWHSTRLRSIPLDAIVGHAHIDAWASQCPSRARLPEAPPTKETPMPRLIHAVLDTVTRALSPSERVHFHTGDHGRPNVCEHPRCNSLALHTAQR